MVYADVSIAERGIYFAKECFLMRKLVTGIVDLNENVHTLVEYSKQVALNCDKLDEFLDVPIEFADTTKSICSSGKELKTFVSLKKHLDSESIALLQECYEKFDFASKAVRVGVTIVVQEIEKDLNVREEQSVVSFVQADAPFPRQKTVCPLDKSTLDRSMFNPQLQNNLKRSRRSSVHPSLSISRYMDTTDVFY